MTNECKHCEGTGRCGADNCWGASCDTCAKKSGFERRWWQTNPTVVCSVCGGKGWIEESMYGPRLPKAPWMKF